MSPGTETQTGPKPPAAPGPGAGRAGIGAKIMLLVLALGLAGLGAEGVLRLTAKPAPSMVFAPFAAHMTKNRLDDFLGVVSEDPELFWKLAPGRRLPDDAWPIRGLIANAAGLREPREIPVAKPPGEVRILFLGDSCTFGFGALEPEGFVAQAEQLLNARFPHVRTECVNAGVPGYSLFQGWRWLESRGLAYDPDLVIATFGWNDDRTWADQSDLQQWKRKQAALPPPGLRSSQLLCRIWEAAARWGEPPRAAKKQIRVPPAEFRELLERIRQTAAERGMEMRVVVWPMRRDIGDAAPTPHQEVLRDFGARHGGLAIDPLPRFREALATQAADRIYIDQGHVRPLGNQLVAESVVEAISPWFEARFARP